ncbi:MAG: bifunctional N-acetylglucosamine-1-phosphate uridyltransferase/glucosamine-1-phosphate acetyltransferase [Candidatus Aureabacteria bacterium]|nr:bifunctional N-acetylglucosamine-1-phosphate uridyltransferase/glucosamine-1-phosphate acetyltransferase [Candidatus Auribacterota bacterium]
MKNITAVVLAAGKSKRMRSSTSKVLHKLQGKTVISYVYSSLKKAGVGKAVTVASIDNINGLKKEAEKVGIRSLFAIQKQQKGTSDAVRTAFKSAISLGNSIIVTSGDMPLVSNSTYKKLINKFYRTKADCTMLTGKMPEPYGYGRIIRSSNKIIDIREEKDLVQAERSIDEINAGVYVFKTSALKKFIKNIKNKNRQKEFYLTDIISLFVQNGQIVNSVTLQNFEELQGINTREDLRHLMSILWKWKNKELMVKGVTIEDPDTTYIDMDVVIGKDTVIKPFTVIESGTKVGSNCEIGPFSHIRNSAVIMDTAEVGNFVEVKKSIIKPGAKAKHLSYLGDSVVGKKANIGAGTITANFDGKNKFVTNIGDNCYIGSNTVLIAPVTLKKGVKTGSGTVVTRNQIIPQNSLIVGVPGKIIKKLK